MKTRICIVDNSISFTGAFKCALIEWELLHQQYDFLFVVPDNSAVIPFLEERGIRYYSLPFVEINKKLKQLALYGPVLLLNAVKLKRILKMEGVTVVQVNDFYNLAGAAVKILGYKGKLITYVRFLPSIFPSPLRSLWTTMARKFSHAVVAVSDAVLAQLPNNRKFLRIYDAVSFPETVVKSPEQNFKDVVVFLYLSNFTRGKGQDHALRAFHKMVHLKKNLVLKFVGGDMGLSKNKAFKKELEDYVVKHNLQQLVYFEPFQANIEEIIKSSDVLLNFSEAESFSMTCAEASFYGLPVIATRCGGPEEIIIHEKTGLLVENRNVDHMAEAMERLAGSAELRARFGDEAKKSVVDKFNKEEYIQQFIKVIESERL